ncbi:AAA family ATPase [Nocardia sp. NPDC127579]|uniref:AAA family ATPase n=1 Tax=Nocardia sp. NPDC127579 TaxID=3345402 RepID=UPI00363D8C0C
MRLASGPKSSMIDGVVRVSASGVFVGRGNELAELLRAAADARVRAVLVAGAAGIGKSRLVAEFVARRPSGTLVLSGRCPEFGNAGVPFAPFLAVSRALVRELGVASLRALLPSRPALAAWLPELAEESAAGASDPLRLFGELLALLEQLPAVLVLEDLHWADESSLELLAFLAANLAEPRALILGTYRPAGSPVLRRLVAELGRTPAVRIITPEPLTRHEVGRQLAALLGREPDPALIARVFARSGGNPLFVEALSGSPEDTPAELSELLLAAQADLADDSRAVLRLAAVLDSPVDHDLLAAATDRSGGALRNSLRQLIDHHILTATDTGYEFRHVLIREAVYQDLLPVERTRLHARVTEVLRERPSLLDGERVHAVLSRHACAAGEFRTALESALAAAALADGSGAHPERLHHLETVLRVWDQAADGAAIRLDSAPANVIDYWSATVDRRTVLEHLVESCCRIGSIPRGIEAANEALAQVDSAADPLRAASLHRLRAQLRNQDGTGGRDDLQHALSLLPADPPSMLRGEIHAELAATEVFAGNPAPARAHAEAVLAIAEAPASDHRGTTRRGMLTARALAYLGLAEEDSTTSMTYFARARAAAEVARDGQTVVSVLTWQAAAQVNAGAHHAAIQSIRDGLRAADAGFQRAARGPILLVKWAQALAALGEWEQAEELITETLGEPLPSLAAAALQLCRARIAVSRGEFELAGESTAAAADLLGDSGWVGQYRLELSGLRVELAQADPPLAARLMTSALDGDAIAEYPHEVWTLLARSTRIAGLPVDLAPYIAKLPVTTPLDAAHHATCTATTPDSWRAALAAWADIPQPFDRAHTLLAHARSALSAGDRAAAHESLRTAATLAAGLGAHPLGGTLRDVADRAGLSLDDTPAPAAPTPRTFGLTARELEVLRLVAQGLSNRQLATELFISPNTAGVHVSRILTKLSATTRTEAATLAHHHNLLT